jgi:hypothetical protein
LANVARTSTPTGRRLRLPTSGALAPNGASSWCGMEPTWKTTHGGRRLSKTPTSSRVTKCLAWSDTPLATPIIPFYRAISGVLQEQTPALSGWSFLFPPHLHAGFLTDDRMFRTVTLINIPRNGFSGWSYRDVRENALWYFLPDCQHQLKIEPM